MFIKQIIYIKSGDGGNGLISFLKIRNKIFPNGGNGGNGGDVYLNCNNNTKIISKINYSAENGKTGKNKIRHGKTGQSLIIKFPIGSYIEIENYKIYLVCNNFFVKILKGGKGGLGNHYFKNYFNKKIATKGEKTKFVTCLFVYKFFIKSFVLNINSNNLDVFKINFISKIYLIIINLNIIHILIKIIKFYFYFLYLKNFKNNYYWIILNINKNIFFLKLFNKIKLIVFPTFFISKIFNFGLKKIIHYLFLWKNS
ncbi:putative GTPase [Candidatus Carsonella ruddii PV]|uniref:Putative GTPase n=1 Tax=Carsonella ruddii (strain PV) TaxID=387662 RepID=Q05FK9_CARRP|nr:putative GTPase [Candidatus Carsonella ruddii]BAF35162.1 putative GTPase [Candidatus Carsonella ruddii PV]